MFTSLYLTSSRAGHLVLVYQSFSDSYIVIDYLITCFYYYY